MNAALLPHDFWAKREDARDAGQGRSRLSLISHSLDVAVVFRRLASLPPFRDRFDRSCGHPLVDLHLDRLAVIALLHDLGKANWGFQARMDPQAPITAGHVLEGAAFIFREETRGLWPSSLLKFLEETIPWFSPSDEGLFWMLLAALSHHGKPISLSDIESANRPERFWGKKGTIDPANGVSQLVETARREFAACFSLAEEPINATPGLQHRFAGLVMLADWIGSDTRFFPLGEESNRREIAEEGADKAFQTIGLVPKRPISLPSFETCFGEGFRPNPLQTAVEGLPLGEATRLMLVESDTGSGKTEAALRWFLRLYQAGKVDGLYFALPTRVAARELYGRVLRTIQAAFPEAADRPSPILLAVPGYVRADGEARALPDPGNRLWEDSGRMALSEKVWAAERPKRFLAAPVGVGTIDQALLSALKVKHSLLRSVCLDRHLLVVDEVHASDTYMTEILAHLLNGHVERGGYAMLLSATLGESARAKCFGAAALPLEGAIRRPYPAICTRDREIAVEVRGTSKVVRHCLLPSLDDDALILSLREALAAGCRVLAVCNTVGRAQRLQRAVESAGFNPEWLFRYQERIPCPHHGRFAQADREVLDQAVTARFGKNTPDGPVLLIGTQTLEQSLDIDADFLVMDLAPMDVLLQRVGRLHRHRRNRPPGYETARVLIRTPDKPLPTYLDAEGRLRAPAGLGTVYEDGRVLQRTLDILSSTESLELPGQNRRLVEAATHEEALDGLPAPWVKHADWLWGPRLTERREAETALLAEQPFGELHYPDDGRRLQTRLGASDVVLRFKAPVLSPFGQTISEILLPSRWLNEFMDDRPVAATPIPEGNGLAFEVGGRRFSYTRFGLEWNYDKPAA